VLAFELASEGEVLLFPGDAQVGNWLSWETLEWCIKEGTETRTVSTACSGARSKAAWDRFVARTDVQDGWVDYTLEW
jgi:hypothetical protein